MKDVAGASEEEMLRSVALKNAQAILEARLESERELVQAKHELVESRELLRMALRAAGAGAFRWQPQRDIVVLGENLIAMLRLDRAAGHTTLAALSEVFAPAERSRFLAVFNDAARDSGQVSAEFLRDDAGGAGCWLEVRASTMAIASEQSTWLVGTMMDISLRKSAELALAEETEVLETLNRTNAQLASQLDLSTLLQVVTDSATKLSGAQFGAFFYNGVDEHGAAMLLFTLSGAPRSAFEGFGHPRPTAVFAPTFRGDEVVRSDDILADPRYGKSSPHFGLPKGHMPVRSYLAVPVKSRAGPPIGGLFFGHAEPGIFHAKTERVVAGIAAQAAVAVDNARMYDDLRRAAAERESLLDAERAARTEAERAGLMKDEFLSTLSHELRTPLNAVLGWANIMTSPAADVETLRRGAETIARNAQAQARLIEDLLDMNLIVSGKIRMDVRPTLLEGIVDAALEAVRPTAEVRQVTLVKLVEDSVGPVSADPTRLQQIVWNLLSNAVKFTGHEGTVTVRLRRAGASVELSVSDDGIGIAPTFLPHVFDRFRQADSSTTRRVGGLGLGLAIVKQLVELHGGSVSASSEGEGLGSTFVVSLPLLSARAQRTADAISVASPIPAASSQDVELSGLKVLVVDDEPDASAMVRMLLAQVGAEVVTAISADEALEQLRAAKFDLLISDIGMPGNDGYELIRQVRKDESPELSQIPSIALTAFARSEDRARAMLAGYQIHLAKPVDSGELIASAASLLGRFSR